VEQAKRLPYGNQFYLCFDAPQRQEFPACRSSNKKRTASGLYGWIGSTTCRALPCAEQVRLAQPHLANRPLLWRGRIRLGVAWWLPSSAFTGKAGEHPFPAQSPEGLLAAESL